MTTHYVISYRLCDACGGHGCEACRGLGWCREEVPLTRALRDLTGLGQFGWLDSKQAVLHKPIRDLNLSVRARKCMARKGISTIGDLIRVSADELLECKGFGETTLDEIRHKLEALGVKLRGE